MRRNRGSSGRTGRSGEEVGMSDSTRQQFDRRKPERKEDSGKHKSEDRDTVIYI